MKIGLCNCVPIRILDSNSSFISLVLATYILQLRMLLYLVRTKDSFLTWLELANAMWKYFSCEKNENHRK